MEGKWSACWLIHAGRGIGKEMEEVKIRLLRADEIECRISMINERGLSLLLFKDARVDQKILDETFTPFGWKRSHQVIDGNLYCTVEIWDREKGQWVGKQDVGTMSYSEKEKGQASDSFKRACFNWGLGRELYTAPFIWIPAEAVNIQKKEKDREQKYYTNDRFRVQAISYDKERAIDFLIVVNARNQAVYSMDKRKGAAAAEKNADAGTFTEKQPGKAVPVEKLPAGGTPVRRGFPQKETAEQNINVPGNRPGCLSQGQRDALEKELERTGVALDAVLQRYHLTSAEQMDQEVYGKAMKSLKKSKDKEAA